MEKETVVTQLEHSENEVAEEVVDEEVEVEEESNETTEDTKPEQESTTQEKADDKPKKQSSAERKRFAEMRRAKEAKEREQAIAKAKQEGIIEGLGGTNPYTGEKIVDDIDFEFYQEMRDAESKGYDPNNRNDMLKYRKEVRLEAKKQEQAQAEIKSKATNDIKEFQEKNPDVDINKLLNDEKFQEFMGDSLGKLSLNEIYRMYNLSNVSAKKQAEEIALDEKARRASSTGSLSSGDNVEEELTLEQISKMSREEIEKNYDKVMKAYWKK